MPSTRRCVFGCVTKGVTVHNFPQPRKFSQQFRIWVELAGESLKGLSDEEIYETKKVCAVHFVEKNQNRNNRLNALAVPSLHIPSKEPAAKFLRKSAVPSIFTFTKTKSENPKAIERQVRLEKRNQSQESAAQEPEKTASGNIQYDGKMNSLVTEFCRTCLAFDNVKLWPLQDSPLKTTLNFLLGVEVKKNDVSTFICCECKALLRKYHRFRARGLRTQKLLRVLANAHGEVEPIKASYLRKIRLESRLHTALVEDHLVTGTDLFICSHQDHQLTLPSVADDHCYVPSYVARNPSREDGARTAQSDVTSSGDEVLHSEKLKNENSKEILSCERRLSERDSVFEMQLLKAQPRVSVLRSYLPSRKSVSLVAKSRAVKTSEASATRTDSVSQELRNQITRLIETDGKWDGTMQDSEVTLDKEDLEPAIEKPHPAPEPNIRRQLLESAFATEVNLGPEEQLAEMEERGKMKSYLKARFRCKLCLTGFQRDEKYRMHLATVHDENLGEYVCEMCHYRFNRSFKLQNHLASAHLKRYQCLQCPHRSKTQYMARLHGLWHTKENYPCKVCDRIFDSIRAVQRHIYTAHERGSRTRTCAASANYLEARKGSARRVKPRPSPHPCPRCIAVLTGPRALDAHLRAAHGERRANAESRKYMCEVCGERCASLGSLRSHLLRHTHAKPHKCEQCGSSFATAWRLRQHERRHSGDRPFPCSVCAKRFITKTHLNRHLRIHTGLKPYVCMYCGRAFVQSTAMRDHIKIVHFKMRRRRAPRKTTRKDETVINDQRVNIEQSVASEPDAEMELNVEYDQGVDSQSVEYFENVEYLENDENVETEIVYGYNSDYVLNTI